MLRIFLLCILVLGVEQTASASVVRVANGDCTGLAAAITTATQDAGQSTTILLARNGSYSGCSINMNVGNVVIDGQGTQMQFFSACLGSSSASLTLRNLSIGAAVSPSRSQALCAIATGDIGVQFIDFGIVNNGSLTLDSVSLQSLSPPQPTANPGLYGAFVASYGSVVLRNVTAINLVTPLIENSGKLEIYNSTVLSNHADELVLPRALFGNDGSAFVANSIVSGPSPLCSTTTPPRANDITSGGGNFASDTSCGFSPVAGDVIAQSPGFGAFGGNGGLVPTQALTFSSPARSIGVAQYCEAVDARGYTRAATSCDAGAYEYGGGAGALTASGLNGVFYDAAADGHYVSIQRIHDNGDIVVIWNTFDQSGNPAWIYGVGQLVDKHIHAAMAQNLGGVLQPGGPALGSKSRAWGTVDIDLSSCLLAQFNYQSGFSEFGSGTFPLTRLAIVADFGCSN